MRRSLVLGFALAIVLTDFASAQTLGTPVFQGPYRNFQRGEFSAYLSDPGEGASVGLEAEYRFAPRSYFDVGLQAGWINGSNGGSDLFAVGGDFRLPVVKASESFPLDGSLTAGLGLVFGEHDFFGGLIPLGISVGRRVLLENSQVSFVPWVHPVLAPTFGDLNDTQFGLGLGVDVALTRQFDLRVSGAVGDYEGVGLGVAFHR